MEDYDPEIDVLPNESDQSSDDSDSGDHEPAGTEHYETVGYTISETNRPRTPPLTLCLFLGRASSVAMNRWP